MKMVVFLVQDGGMREGCVGAGCSIRMGGVGAVYA